MTGKQIRDALIAWCDKIVQVDMELPEIITIVSHQDAPAPNGQYLVVPYNIARSPIGRASEFKIDDENSELVSDWTGTIEIREVNGDGDLLIELIKSLDRSDILDTYFRKKGLVHYTSGQAQPIPSLTNEHWNKESIVEITIGLAETAVQTTSYIETVDIERVED